MAKKLTDEDVEGFMRQLKLLIGLIVAIIVVPLIVYAIYLNRRLDEFENTMKHSPPEELETVGLDRNDLFDLSTNLVEGQVVYVPAYSHVYHSDGKPNLLTITLSVRNTSLKDEIIVKSVRYFNTKGKEVKAYLQKPVRLPALGTTEIIVEREDTSGGSGANFLVEWYATTPVTAPLIESVMIDTNSQQGISFVLRGSVISEFASQSRDEAASQTKTEGR